ncbi:MAG: hypothetical protein GY803_20555 [Chloroflexi bacterium]|nr:hypothetical protein [Chloroflexota bacterium]
MPQFSPIQVRNVLRDNFNFQELKDICFELGIRYEDLGGTGVAGKALALVQYAQRHSRFDDLVAQIQTLRPNAGLGEAPAAVSDDQGPSPKPETGGVTHVYVSGDYVRGGKVAGDQVGGDKIDVESIEGSGIALGKESSATVTSGDTIQAGGDIMTAGGDININANPQNKAEFEETLKGLKQLLEKALNDGEFEDPRDGKDALEELEEISEETGSEEPRQRRIKRSLDNLTDILGDTSKAVEAAGKAGAALLKAAPIIAGLIKAASVIF